MERKTGNVSKLSYEKYKFYEKQNFYPSKMSIICMVTDYNLKKVFAMYRINNFYILRKRQNTNIKLSFEKNRA